LPLATPVSFEAVSTFGGAARRYTRQRLYDDEDARQHTARGTARVRVPRARRGVDGDAATAFADDPYAEAGYKPLEHTDAEIDQFRADLTSDTFRRLIDRRRHADARRLPAAPTRAVRAVYQRRAAILEAMAASTNAHASLFSLDYAAAVPDEFVREFTSTTEIECVRATLAPALYVRDERARVHMHEMTWRRALADAGCVFKRAETRVLRGHMRTLAPLPPAEDGWYTHERVESEHAHYDARAGVTRLRVLVFQIQTAAASTAADDGASLELRRDSDLGYYVRLVAHLVGNDTRAERARASVCRHEPVASAPVADEDDWNVLCFRSFALLRHDTATTAAGGGGNGDDEDDDDADDDIFGRARATRDDGDDQRRRRARE
jgi:hypothetical protein